MAAPLRKQYHFRKSPNGFYAWDVHRLIDLSAGLPVVEVPLSGIAELDEAYWFHDPNAPTCRAVVGHCRLMADADLSYPIILCAEGRVMDGMHRAAKALLEDRKTVRARRFPETPAPDHTDIHPDELSY